MMKCSGCIVAVFALLFSAITSVNAQSAAEKEALKKIGKAFVVYALGGKIIRADLDGSGGYVKKELYDARSNLYKDAPVPMVTYDGKYVFFRKAATVDKCEIWRMNADGTNAGLFSKESYPYAHYFRISTQKNYDMVFVSNATLQGGAWGSATDTDGWWTHPKLYTMDSQGSSTKVLDLGTSNADYLDISGSLITYRKARANVCVYDLVAKKETVIRQGCGQTLGPDGKKLMINNTAHTGYYIYELSGTSWSQKKSGTFGSGRHRFKWSNHPEWVSLQSEKATPIALYAFNTTTAEQIRITFDDGNTNGGMFIDGATATSRPLVNSQRSVATKTGTDAVYDIRGNLVKNTAHAPQLRIFRSSQGVIRPKTVKR